MWKSAGQSFQAWQEHDLNFKLITTTEDNDDGKEEEEVEKAV